MATIRVQEHKLRQLAGWRVVEHVWWSVDALDADGRRLAYATTPDETGAREIEAQYRTRFGG